MKRLILITVGIVVLLIVFFLGKCSQQESELPEVVHDSPDVAFASEYTCSMHPQIRITDKDAKCPICFMDLIPVPQGAADVPLNAIRMSESAMIRAQIEVKPVIVAFPRRVLQLVGTVEADETKKSSITAWFPGRIEKLYIDYTGASVQAGDPLAEIYSPELLVAQIELQEAANSAKRIKGDSIVARTAKATYVAARNKLSRWGLTETQIDELADADTPSDTITITSPIDGVVLERTVTTGEYVKTGQVLFNIADLEKVWVLLAAHASDLPFLSVNQSVELETDTQPGQRFLSTIEFIDRVINPKTRTASIRLTVDNQHGAFLPGAYVRGRVIGVLDDSDPPLLVPRTSVLLTGRRAVVFVQIPAEQPTFEARVVILGERGDDMYVVKEGLEEGELVVVQGAFKIDSELQIQAKPSMMSLRNVGLKVQNSDEFLQSIYPLFNAYFVAQEALASDDFKAFVIAQADLKTTLAVINDESLKNDTLTLWTKISDNMVNATTAYSDIEKARIGFEEMSKAVLELETTFGHTDGNYYEMYCPMAFDLKGASWLQRKETLENPSFGESMLPCGESKKTYDPNGGAE